MARKAKGTAGDMPKQATKKSTAARKSSAKKAPSEGGAPKKRMAALSEERTHRLRKDQLQRYRMLEAEVRAAQAEYQMADMQYQVLVNGRPEIVSAQTNKKAAQQRFRAVREEYLKYMHELGEMLGMNMKNVAIDDTTGLVREIPTGSPERDDPQ